MREARSAQRDLGSRDAQSRRAVRRVSDRRSSAHRGSRSVCPRGRWATPRSGTSTWVRAASSTRSSRASRRRSRTAPSSRTTCSARRSMRRSLLRALSISWGWSRTAAFTAIRSTSTRWSSWLGDGGSTGSSSTPSSTAATSRRTRVRATCEKLESVMAEKGVGRVATVMGRYYAMDRDNRWERVEQAWRAIVAGEGALGHLGGAGDLRLVRRGRHRRVRRPDRDRGGTACRSRRVERRGRPDLLQLPSRPRARDHACVRGRGVQPLRPQFAADDRTSCA